MTDAKTAPTPEETAATLFPCTCGLEMLGSKDLSDHAKWCDIQNQAAVAAALAERDTEAQATILELRGALKDAKEKAEEDTDMSSPLIQSIEIIEIIDTALSGTDTEKYRELWNVLPAVLRKLRVVAANYSGDKETRETLIPAIIAALSQGEPATKEGE